MSKVEAKPQRAPMMLPDRKTVARTVVFFGLAGLAGCLGVKLLSDFLNSQTSGSSDAQPTSTPTLNFAFAGGGEATQVLFPPTATIAPLPTVEAPTPIPAVVIGGPGSCEDINHVGTWNVGEITPAGFICIADNTWSVAPIFSHATDTIVSTVVPIHK